MIRSYFQTLLKDTRDVSTTTISTIRNQITSLLPISSNLQAPMKSYHKTREQSRPPRISPTTTANSSDNGLSYNRTKSINTSVNPTPAPTLIDRSLFQWLTPQNPSLSHNTPIIVEVDEELSATSALRESISISPTYIPMAQPSQDDPILSSASHMNPWGDPLPKIDTCKTLRIVYQNVHHSLQPSSSNPSTLQIVDNLQNLNCSVFCASETNLNWFNPSAKAEIRQAFQKSFQQVHLSTASSTVGTFKEHRNARLLPGGTAILTFDHWVNKISASGTDSRQLGRWCHTTITGKNNRHITIICAYRTCRQGPASGALTAHSQQVLLIETEFLHSNKSSQHAPIPREECIKDLDQLLKSFQDQDHGIILCIDANETPVESCSSDGTPKRYSIESLLHSRGLIEVCMHQHKDRPSSSTTTPNRFID